jgi:hypothetical protein
VAGGIDRGTADEVFAAGYAEAEFGLDGVKDADGLGHDFGTDAVSGENGDAVTA